MEFNLYDPSFDFWQQSGVVGLKLAIASLTENPYKFTAKVEEYKLQVSWEGNDFQAWDWLLGETFRLSNGIIATPFSNPYTHLGMLDTLLQIPKTRPTDGQSELTLFENSQGKISRPTLLLKSYIHQGFGKKLWSQKRFSTPSWLMPNSVVDPQINIDRQGAIACLFAPLTTCFFEISFEKKGLIIPIFSDLAGEIIKPELTDYFADNLHDAACRTLLLNPRLIGVTGYTYRKKQANRPPKIVERVEVWRKELDWDAIASAYESLPTKLIEPADKPPFVARSQLRGAIVENIVQGHPAYHELINKVDLRQLGYQRQGIRELFFGKGDSPVAADTPLVDDCDRHLLDSYRWRKGKDCGWFRRYREGGKQKTVYLHRQILGITGNQSWQVVFHDGNKSNCRRENLEMLTMSEFSKRYSVQPH